MPMTPSRLLLASSLALVLGACPDFAALDADGTCGNGILEPFSGEDCDSHDVDGFACGAPTGDNGCRFVCDDGAACPDGWGCGLDGRCRAPSGQFSDPIVVDTRGANLYAADVDGDGRDDVLSLESGVISLAFADADRVFRSLQSLPNDTLDADPAICDLDLDGRADVLAPFIDGVMAFRGLETRTLVPVAVPSEVLELDIMGVKRVLTARGARE